MSRLPIKLPSDTPSLLPLLHSACNLLLPNGPYNDSSGTLRVRTRSENGSLAMEETVTPFFVSDLSDGGATRRPVGFLRPNVLSALRSVCKTYRHDESPWRLYHADGGKGSGSPWAVSFSPWVNNGGFASRSSHMNSLVSKWRNLSLFPSPLDGWSNEQYPVYHPDEESRVSAGTNGTVAFAIERAALPLFSFANYGCLLTAYFRSQTTGETKIWVPRRSRTKKSWPGRLDVTVGGGISHSESPLTTIIRECAEEASLDPTFVEQHIRPAGIVSFPNRAPSGWILPGLYYVFDLPLLPDGTPAPRVNEHDGEVESFEAMGVQEVVENLVKGAFKPSSAIALVDFLVRHGYLTPASDARYVDVCLMLRKDLILPVPW